MLVKQTVGREIDRPTDRLYLSAHDKENCVKRILFIVLICTVWVIHISSAQDQTPEPQPSQFLPSHADASLETWGDGLRLELFFTALAQGQTGWVRLSGDIGYGARAYFAGQVIDLISLEGEHYYGLVGVGLETLPGVYEVIIETRRDDFSSLETPASESPFVQRDVSASFEVLDGGFVQQAFTIPDSRAFLLDDQREADEYALLSNVVTQITPRALWVERGFGLPLEAEITSPFGAFRRLNGFFATRHTGWDLRAPMGTPIMAMADGIVAFADVLDIRGDHLVIDHGYGVFSGYSHLSETLVEVGDSVQRGQIVALSGSTGRVNGPHLHWEVTVNGQWVDSIQFLTLWTDGA